MNRLSIGSVWQSMYILDQTISNSTKISRVISRTRQTHTHTHTGTIENPRSGNGSQNHCHTKRVCHTSQSGDTLYIVWSMETVHVLFNVLVNEVLLYSESMLDKKNN